MKNYIKTFTPVVLAIVIGSLTFVFGQTSERPNRENGRQHQGQRPPMRGGLPPHVIEKLDLSDEQKTQIGAIEFNSRDAGKQYFETVRTADEKLRTMTESGVFDENAARQILSEKAEAMIGLELVRLRTDAAIFKVLTAEQKARLEQLKNERPPMPPPPPAGAEGFRPDGN